MFNDLKKLKCFHNWFQLYISISSFKSNCVSEIYILLRVIVIWYALISGMQLKCDMKNCMLMNHHIRHVFSIHLLIKLISNLTLFHFLAQCTWNSEQLIISSLCKAKICERFHLNRTIKWCIRRFSFCKLLSA